MPRVFYAVVPRPEGGWSVLNELDIPVRHGPKDLMERYANDPAWRYELAEQAAREEAMWKARQRG